jgi:hypothetical protein
MRYAVLFTALALTACASTGVNVTDQQVQSFHKGSTTYAEVASRLGPPSSVTSMADGSRIAIYSYGHYQTRAASFIPIVGMFAGGGDIHASAASFTFDPNGILKDWTLTTAAQGVATGVAAGSKSKVSVKN